MRLSGSSMRRKQLGCEGVGSAMPSWSSIAELIILIQQYCITHTQGDS